MGLAIRDPGLRDQLEPGGSSDINPHGSAEQGNRPSAPGRSGFGGDIDLIDELFAEGAIDHTLLGDTRGREPIKARVRSLRAAFSDFRASVEQMVAEGNLVALRAIDRGTHDGDFMGLPPTGQQVEYAATAFFRIEDARIVERWVQPDLFGVMRQLGAVAPAAP